MLPGLSGLGTGMILACFHMAGIESLLKKWFMRWVRVGMPPGPRYFRCLIVMQSKPLAYEFPLTFDGFRHNLRDERVGLGAYGVQAGNFTPDMAGGN